MLSAGGSFGGAKPKALMDIAGEPWIIKFFNNEPVDVPPIEHALMTLAKQAGTLVAQTQVVPALRRLVWNATFSICWHRREWVGG